MEKSKNICYVPLDVQLKSEIFSGFGKSELVKSLCGSLIGLGFSFILYLFTGQIMIMIVTLAICMTISFSLNVKDRTTNFSFVDEVGNFLRFAKTQKEFKYTYLYEYDFEENLICNQQSEKTTVQKQQNSFLLSRLMKKKS